MCGPIFPRDEAVSMAIRERNRDPYPLATAGLDQFNPGTGRITLPRLANASAFCREGFLSWRREEPSFATA